jgi:hypothetical protein
VGEAMHRHTPEIAAARPDESEFRAQYDLMAAAGYPTRAYADAWNDMQVLRSRYMNLLLGFATLLLVEPEFRTHGPSLPE